MHGVGVEDNTHELRIIKGVGLSGVRKLSEMATFTSIRKLHHAYGNFATEIHNI